MIDRKRLRRPAERLEEPAETLIADDGAFGPDFPFTDRLVVDTLVRAFFIVMRHVFDERPAQMIFGQEDDVVQAFIPGGPDEALGEGIHIRRMDRGVDRPQAPGCKNPRQRLEFAIVVVDPEFALCQGFAVHRRRPDDVLQPFVGRVLGDPEQMHPPGIVLDREEEELVGDVAPEAGRDLDEIQAHGLPVVVAPERRPGRSLSAVFTRREAVLIEDPADRRPGQFDPALPEFPLDALEPVNTLTVDLEHRGHLLRPGRGTARTLGLFLLLLLRLPFLVALDGADDRLGRRDPFEKRGDAASEFLEDRRQLQPLVEGKGRLPLAPRPTCGPELEVEPLHQLVDRQAQGFAHGQPDDEADRRRFRRELLRRRQLVGGRGFHSSAEPDGPGVRFNPALIDPRSSQTRPGNRMLAP